MRPAPGTPARADAAHSTRLAHARWKRWLGQRTPNHGFEGSFSITRSMNVASGPRSNDRRNQAKPLRFFPCARPALISANVPHPTAYPPGSATTYAPLMFCLAKRLRASVTHAAIAARELAPTRRSATPHLPHEPRPRSPHTHVTLPSTADGGQRAVSQVTRSCRRPEPATHGHVADRLPTR